jgi:hypothetical protein
MGFLRRLLSGAERGSAEPVADDDFDAKPADPATIDAEERARDLELARFDQDRISDLVRRQQQYADRSWTPPPQGGERRSGDEDA